MDNLASLAAGSVATDAEAPSAPEQRTSPYTVLHGPVEWMARSAGGTVTVHDAFLVASSTGAVYLENRPRNGSRIKRVPLGAAVALYPGIAKAPRKPRAPKPDADKAAKE